MQKDESVFVDANIFMDILQKRRNWESSLKILNAIRNQKIAGYVSPLTTAILYFLRRNELTDAGARRDVRDSISGLKVLDLSSKHIFSALDDDRFNDFEDALQFQSAKERASVIITRNKKHFSKVAKKIEVLTPEEFIRQHKI